MQFRKKGTLGCTFAEIARVGRLSALLFNIVTCPHHLTGRKSINYSQSGFKVGVSMHATPRPTMALNFALLASTWVQREYLHRARTVHRIMFLDNPPENCPTFGLSKWDTLAPVWDACDGPTGATDACPREQGAKWAGRFVEEP